MSTLLNTPVAGTEAPRAGDFISSEANGTRSRSQGTLAALNDSSTKYVAGTVLGQKNVAAAGTFAISAAGATCGTITLATGVKEGVYSGECIKAGATGMFDLVDPDGHFVGTVTVGTAFSGGGLGFTLTDAGAHVAVGDTMTITVGKGTYAATGGNTGNFTCGAITVDPGVTAGVYTFTLTDATHFSGVDPDGKVLPAGNMAAAYHAGGLDFRITAGATPGVAGDSFTITTDIGDMKWYAVNTAGVAGEAVAAGILIYPADVSGATDLKVAILRRDAEVKESLLAFPANVSDDAVRSWKADLAAKGIRVRSDLV